MNVIQAYELKNSETMKTILKFLIASIIFLLLSQFSNGQDRKGEEKIAPKKQLISLQKSLLIPGWGQIAEKRYIEGALFLSAEIFCVYKIFSYNHKGNYYYERYKKADNVTDAVRYRELTEKYDTQRNKFFLAAAGTWVLNLLDIYLIVKSKEKKKRNLNLKLEQNENKTLVFAISYSF